MTMLLEARKSPAKMQLHNSADGAFMAATGLTHTTTELLDGLHDSANSLAWSEFDRRFRPILIGFLRRSGLGDFDAADVAQETLTCFVRDYRAGKYDRTQGRLRSWLIGIARYRVADARRAVGRRREYRGESAIVDLPADIDAESIWEAEQREFIFSEAISELRRTSRFSERTIEAFERVVLQREPVERVSVDLGLTAQEIYNAKNRIVQRLREIAQQLEAAFNDC